MEDYKLQGTQSQNFCEQNSTNTMDYPTSAFSLQPLYSHSIFKIKNIVGKDAGTAVEQWINNQKSVEKTVLHEQKFVCTRYFWIENAIFVVSRFVVVNTTQLGYRNYIRLIKRKPNYANQ